MKLVEKYKKKYFENFSVNLKFKIRALMFADILIVLDLLSKIWADSTLKEAPIKVIDGFFSLSLAHNKGVSFSMFHDLNNGDIILAVLAIYVGSIILFASFGLKRKNDILGYLLIFAGAFGNGIDRTINGHVIDFLDVYYKNWHYPTFNLADCFIFVGVVLIIVGDIYAKRNKATI